MQDREEFKSTADKILAEINFEAIGKKMSKEMAKR